LAAAVGWADLDGAKPANMPAGEAGATGRLSMVSTGGAGWGWAKPPTGNATGCGWFCRALGATLGRRTEGAS